MSDARFQGLLKDAMGLDVASIGDSTIDRAVRVRLEACRLPNLDSYWTRASASTEELQELIEAVIVPETWFFRDRAAFAALAQIAVAEWLPAHASGSLRILSVPCSTGEEPYSIAMALSDVGFPENRLAIDAVDISARALAKAMRASYGRNSFRGADLQFRDRHFEPAGGSYRLAEGVRRRVRFERGNLLAPGFAAEAGCYDVIFCRNLLIYFDRPTQDRALAVLSRLLARMGVLFVGPSETGLLLEHRFVPAKLPMAFAFRKAQAGAAARTPAPVAVPTGRRPAAGLAEPKPRSSSPAAAVHSRRAATPDLAEATRLADRGELQKAQAICRAHLEAQGPSAEAYYLSGLLADASGQVIEATEAYRKALYLEPRHRESLLHLASLLDRHGDRPAAQRMRERARRLARDA